MTPFPKQKKEPDIKEITLKLLEYCRSQNWAGYDPYDALNSRLFRALGLSRFKYPRLIFTQLLKRCPINLRPLLLIPKEQNPKGIALFLSAAVKLKEAGLLSDEKTIHDLTDTLIGLSSSTNGYIGWGYNFDWQTRGVLVPRGTPNIICTTFAANALLDVHQYYPHPRLLDLAGGSARFLVEKLYQEYNEEEACFSYFPQASSQVHNANLLGAALLCRVAHETGDKTWLPPALKAAQFSIRKQQPDGSWYYGEAPTQRWIDNFHTGFNLCALHQINRFLETTQFEPAITSGFDFFRRHFITAEGAPRYYYNSLYPIDIHSASQSIITLVTFKNLDPENLLLAEKILAWTENNLKSSKGYYYFQKHPYWTIPIPYMRWSQAWILLALVSLTRLSK